MSWSVECATAEDFLISQLTRSVALVIFSPPYGDQRKYSIGFNLCGQKWVDWLRPIIVESTRVSSGLVIVNAAGPVEGHKYQPIMEWLVADLTRLDGLVCGPSPYAWVKSANHEEADGNGVFGSGGKRYQRRDWEPLYAFCLPDRLPLTWTDNTAFGKPPKPDSFGGEASHRDKNGVRANDWKGKIEHYEGRRIKRKKRQTGGRGRKVVDGPGFQATPPICNPGNVIRAPVGGGKLGNMLAHENEAPMSLGVAERPICWFAPPGSIVCDPFCGSGTTAEAAVMHGRKFIGCDIRQSQVDLTRRRMKTVTAGLFA